MRVRITKINVSKNPLAATPAWDGFKPGIDNGNVSLPVDYYVEGRLIEPIALGATVKMDRDNRNGVKMPGYFISSPVTKITNDGFETQNSIYSLTKI